VQTLTPALSQGEWECGGNGASLTLRVSRPSRARRRTWARRGPVVRAEQNVVSASGPSGPEGPTLGERVLVAGLMNLIFEQSIRWGAYERKALAGSRLRSY